MANVLLLQLHFPNENSHVVVNIWKLCSTIQDLLNYCWYRHVLDGLWKGEICWKAPWTQDFQPNSH